MRGDFYVAAGGDDAHPGTARKPFATLTRARDAVRSLKKGGLQEDVTVLVRGGTYRLGGPLVFGPEDSGGLKRSITYAAYPGERPVFSGGRRITGWRKGRGKRWTVELPEVKAGEWRFRQLFVNGRRAVRARSPNTGFFHVVKAGPDRRSSFTFRPGDVKPWADLRDVEVVFLHDWCTSRVRIGAVDEKPNTVKLADPIGGLKSRWSFINSFEPHPRYYVENAAELLDAPGEWHLDRRRGVLSYYPRPGEDMTNAEVVAPVLGRLLEVRGDAKRPVRNLRFRGLTFAHSEWALPKFGYAAAQAAFHEARPAHGKPGPRERVPTAVEFERTVACRVEGCRFRHLGGSGLSLRRGCHENRVEGNEFFDIAGNGVMVGETGQSPADMARRNTVSNNLVHHCGALFYGSVGVWAGITEGTVIAHNEIRDLPYTGVSVGWQWNPKPTPCKGNRVENNHIHHVMQMLSDGGGIYTLGRQPGTVLRGNHIHDIPANAGRAESNGMFIDEGSSQILIESNVIHAVARSSIRFHKATGNRVRNNTLFLAPRRTPFMFNACRKDTMTFENNVAVPEALRAAKNAKVGAGLNCDGIASHLAVPHNATLEPKQLTLEAWVKLPAYPTGRDKRRWIVSKNSNEWEQGHYGLIIDNTGVGAYLNIGGGRANCHFAKGTVARLELNRWHHLAMTYDGTDLKVYLDGVLGGSTKVGKARRPGRGALDIGRRPDGFVCFRGLIDEVRLYARALAAADIERHANAPGNVKADRALVKHWAFEEQVSRPKALADAASKAGLEPRWRRRLAKRRQGPSRPVVGAIRWDAWTGGKITEQVERTLGPKEYHDRLPWFAKVVDEKTVRIDGGRQSVMDREIVFAANAGLDYWAFLVYPEASPMSAALKQYLKSSKKERVKFCLILHSTLKAKAGQWPRERDRIVKLLQTPGYQTVLNGRPLVYAFCGNDLPFDRFAELRAAVTKAGIKPYYVYMGWRPVADFRRVSPKGFDAVSAYAMGGELPKFAQLVAAVEAKYWRTAAKARVPLVPMVTTGWDKRPRQDHPVSWEKGAAYHEQKVFPSRAAPKEIAQHLQRAVEFCDANPKVCPARAVIVYAWNEYDEGGWLAPTRGADGVPDTGRLDAIRTVLQDEERLTQ
jgi:concanavalin A-like lectin/glucanase superfamily protein/glycosyl hydrolase family 141/parallel beta helix pectate lyase-like protein